MVRKTSRRFANYSKQNEEQPSNEQLQPEQSTHGYDNNSAIADMAQGFIQAQAKMSNNIANNNNLEIALLLQKCNSQLEAIRRSAQEKTTPAPNKQSFGGESQSPPDENKQQENTITTQELQKLLTSIGQANTSNRISQSQSQSQNQSQEQSQSPASIRKNTMGQQSSGGNSPQNMMAVQTVNQVLAQAQYELANELENSLKKLKQVISESEKIADNISNLLGEETTKKS